MKMVTEHGNILDRTHETNLEAENHRKDSIAKEAFYLSQKESSYGLWDYIVGVFCSLLALGICWSRISLGSHSWNQVMIGAGIGLLAVICLNFTFLDRVIVNLVKRQYLLPISVIMTLLHFSYSIISFFFNEPRLKNSHHFLNRPECPHCLDKILLRQGQNHAQAMLLFGFSVGLALNYRFSSSNLTLIDREVNKVSEPIFSWKTYLCRIGIAILCLLPCAIIWGQLKIFKNVGDYSLGACIYEYVSLAAVYFLSGVLLLRFVP